MWVRRSNRTPVPAACPYELVFPNSVGRIAYHTNLVERVLQPCRSRLASSDNAKHSGLNALRHFYASWYINRKTDGGLELPPKIVQTRLGHSSIVMTMDIYGHLCPQTDDGSELANAERKLLRVVDVT
jgi:integrase